MVKTTIYIDPFGELNPENDETRKLLAKKTGTWRIVSAPESHLILEQVDSEAAKSAIGVLGLLTKIPLTDIFALMQMSRHSGSLSVISGAVRKTIFVGEGKVMGARSNQPSDRLGEMLCRWGKLSQAQLDKIKPRLSREKRLGQLLLDEELLTAHELYQCLQQQIEEIFYTTLLFKKGLFVLNDLPDTGSLPGRFSIDINHLLMEGVRRIDEMALFRELLPSPQSLVERKDGARDISALNDREKSMLALIKSAIDVEALCQKSQLGEFEGTKLIFNLMKAGHLQIAAKPDVAREGFAPATSSLEDIARNFNQIFRVIYKVLDQKRASEKFRQALESFLIIHGYYDLFKDAYVDVGGGLNMAIVLKNLDGAQMPNKKEFLTNGLNELLFFEIFLVREVLDPKEEEELMKWVNNHIASIQ